MDPLKEAERLRERGELGEARGLCEALLAREANNAAALGLMAAIAVDEGDAGSGIELARPHVLGDRIHHHQIDRFFVHFPQIIERTHFVLQRSVASVRPNAAATEVRLH